MTINIPSHKLIRNEEDEDEPVVDDWEIFKSSYYKLFTNKSIETMHEKQYQRLVDQIKMHNDLFKQGKSTYEMGINEFADYTEEEYQMLEGVKFTMDDLKNTDVVEAFAPINGQNFTVFGALPDEVDWRKRGYVSPVKSQRKCGSCHIWSAIGAIEGAYKKKTGKLISLSVQQVLDCTPNNACLGGWMTTTYDYLKKIKGVESDASYPYKARKNKCAYKKAKSVTSIKGFINIKSGDEDALKYAIATHGPVAAAIDASRPGFKSYKRGVYFDKNCSSTALTHAILIVGYGKDKKLGDYYLIKNSWSTTFGMKGYMKLARNKNNHCGIATGASVPLL
uniref:Pept_C1 domain-containing protein n=1 Tax=Rhabditophanes sp. KR3021 TaxID=114890 RepID=A0AC35UFM3_9BILA